MHTITPADPADQAAFRKLMGLFATGVCVVSIGKDSDRISGITVNSLVSVSLDPMLVCWSLQNDSSQFAAFSEEEDFTVSILAEEQQALARRYAARGDSALIESDFVRTPRGLPIIGGALGHLECRRWSVYPAGDHTMIFGEVLTISGRSDHRPLAFFGGRFCRIGD